MTAPDDLDRRLIQATQAGLPLVPEPYAALAAELGCSAAEVQRRLAAMLARGAIRRIAAVPHHYALGVRANGMSVWNLADARLGHWGPRIGALPFVSHCYHRPRHVGVWPYNLFAMVHGRSRDEVMAQVEEIARMLGTDDLGHEVLFSTRVLKKTGLRIAG